MKTWHVAVGPNATGLEFDLTWRARAPAWWGEVGVKEGDTVTAAFDHLFQSGFYDGTLTIDGETQQIEGWYGQRDRSRGVRTMSGGQGLHIWYQAQFEDRSVGFLLVETRDHERRLLEGAVMQVDGIVDPIVDVGHDLEFDEGLDLVGGRVKVTTESGATSDPLGDLVSRYARTHGPFTAAEAAARLGLGVAVVGTALKRLAADGRVVEGEFRPHAEPAPAKARQPAADAGAGYGLTPPPKPRLLGHSPLPQWPWPVSEWCDAEVLRKLRRRSLAALRAEVEPVDAAAYGRFLPGLAERPHPRRGPRPAGAARAGRHHHRRRPAVRRAHSGVGLGAAGAGEPGVRLPARHAGRAHGCRGSPLVRRRRPAGQRRLGQPASGRFGRTDAEPGRRLRTRRRAAAAAGPPAEQRRRLLLPPADGGGRRHGLGAERPGRGLGTLGPCLGRPDHRGHVRSGARPDRRRPHRPPAGCPGTARPGPADEPAGPLPRHRDCWVPPG